MSPQDEASRILTFMATAARLKSELRHSWLACGRRESVAEHTWQMALMAMLAHRHLETPVDLARSIEMIVVHDLIEALTGDIPFFEVSERKAKKKETEAEAMRQIEAMLDPATGARFRHLFEEFEARETAEARFAGALDHLEVQVQHNLADLATWTPIEHDLVYTKMDAPCAHDGFLRALVDAVKQQAEAKMAEGGIDVAAVRSRTAAR